MYRPPPVLHCRAAGQPRQLVSFTLPSVQTGTLQISVSGSGTVEIDGAGAFKTP
jgi:hypothetical protein